MHDSSEGDPILQLDLILTQLENYKTASSALSYISAVGATLLDFGNHPFQNNVCNSVPIDIVLCMYIAPDELQKEIGEAVTAHALDLIKSVSWTTDTASNIASVAQSLAMLPMDDNALEQVSR